MSVHCPDCDSESVSWRSTLFKCKTCQRTHAYSKCFFCGSKNTDTVIEGGAECHECDWKGSPYDLCDRGEDRDQVEMDDEKNSKVEASN